jgi:hypothetical protein
MAGILSRVCEQQIINNFSFLFVALVMYKPAKVVKTSLIHIRGTFFLGGGVEVNK